MDLRTGLTGIFIFGLLMSGVSKAEESSPPPAPPANDHFLICKTKKSRLQFDWSAGEIGSGQIDQNSVHYKFRPAKQPAGERGENLKVGECGWAGKAFASGAGAPSEFTMKSLSEETTAAFYRMKTGRVFKLPVRVGKEGVVVLPRSDVSVVR